MDTYKKEEDSFTIEKCDIRKNHHINMILRSKLESYQIGVCDKHILLWLGCVHSIVPEILHNWTVLQRGLIMS